MLSDLIQFEYQINSTVENSWDTIIVRIMEVFKLRRFNSILSTSKGQRINIELRRVPIIDIRIKEIILYYSGFA